VNAAVTKQGVGWDNRPTWHSALTDYQSHRRLMHRIALAGEELGGAT
jgi:alpha-ketoglutarate-dependent taurine dioxygenase